jgi:DNA-binding beta-propeller fold protein YncE
MFILKMSSSVKTDPSGALLPDINYINYRNTSVDLIPVYDKTYQLRNSVGKVVADNFYPFIPPSTFSTSNPYLTRDASNNIYVTKIDGNAANNSTVAVLVNNTFVNLNFTIPNNAFTYYPRGIAFDASGILYITTSLSRDSNYPITLNYETSIVYKVKFTTQTTIISTFNISGISLGDLRGLSFDSSGNLYIADRLSNNIIKVTMVDYNNGIGTIFLPNYTGLNGPLDIKFDQYNNAYIANSLENNIIKVTSSQIISVFATGLLYPTEITFNVVDSTLYVANYGYSQSDSTITSISKIINGSVTQVVQTSFPYGVVSTTTGNIYYTSSSTYNTSNDTAIDTTNTLNVITADNNASYNTTLYTDSLSNTYSISPISSVAFDSTYNFLYAAQYNFINQEIITNNPNANGTIWQISSSISNFYPYSTPIPFYPTASSTGPVLNNPTSIAFDNSSRLYVVNSASNNLIVINSSGTSGSLVDISGVQLSAPSAIVFDGSLNLYVANSISNKICKLTFSDSTHATSVVYDISGSPILTPSGLDFDAEFKNLYISNAGYNNVLKVSMTTNIASIYNLQGVNINAPSGIYFNNSTGILYVSDLDTSTIIQVTNNNYASIVPIIAGDSLIPPNKITIEQPMGLTMDSNNNLYISNYGNEYDPIVKLSIDSSSAIIINAGTLAGPTDATMQPTRNNIYICNSISNIVSILEQSNNLSNYANVGAVAATSITSNIYTGRLYVLFNDGLIRSIGSNQDVSFFNITGLPIGIGARCVRYQHPSINKALFTVDYLYVADTPNKRILKISIDNPVYTGNSTLLAITPSLDASLNFAPTSIAFDSSGVMYLSAGNNTNPSYNSSIVYKINASLNASVYAEIPIFVNTGIKSITFDSYGYLYSLADYNSEITQIYRTTPGGGFTEVVYTFPDTIYLSTLNYIPWEDAILMTDTVHNKLYKLYLSYPFYNMLGRLGAYDNTLFIFDITSGTNVFDVSFNVYTPYLVIDPSNILPNISTNVTFHFVTPLTIPEPTDSYRLECNGTTISNIFCNNCTYNKQKFLAGTYPTGLVFSQDTNYLYVALQNNTISRVSPLGVVENDYFPPELGLNGPTSLILDISYNMFILNVGGGFISYLTLENNIISINNSFYTDIYKPICLTYDLETDLLYLLSGAVPNTRITQINARTGVGTILPLAFGKLYDPNGLSIDAYYGLFAPIDNQPPNTKYLYVSNTDQDKINSILRVNLTTGLYEISTLVSNLLYKPFTMTNQNDGYLYVANKIDNSLSRLSITGLDPNIQRWAVNGISVPTGLCFDGLGNLYVANSGTNPRNSRISKIYTDNFFFTNVKLTNGTCDNAEIYDITSQSCVEVDYYSPPSDPCSFPIPVPYPIGS